MAISVDWATQVITVPQADLTFISGNLYELDTDAFRLELKTLEASEEGMPFLDTHQHNTEVTLGGITFARTIEIINGYTITFTPDSSYRVRFAGSNNNISDVANLNSVSLLSQNSAGLIRVGNSGVERGIAMPQFHFSLFDEANPQTPIAGRTVTGQIAKDGGAFASLTNSIAEIGSGAYRVTGGLTATETDADVFTLLFTATGAESRVIHVVTVPAT